MMDRKPAIPNTGAIIMIGVLVDDLIPAADMKNLFPGTTDQTWAAKRHFGGGPEYVNLGGVGGRKIYYRRAAVEAWIDGNRFTRTDRPVTDAGSPTK
jgi:hypothetical protein